MNEDSLKIVLPLNGPMEPEVINSFMPLVQGRRARVSVVHAIEKKKASDGVSERVETAAVAMEKMGIRASLVVRPGHPSHEILAFAREWGADLIAMTTHGRTGLRRALMGSVTEEVLRQGEFPLLISRPSSRRGDWKRFLVALDGSRAAEEILDEALPLARRLGSTVYLLSVVEPEKGETEESTRAYLEGACAKAEAERVRAMPVLRRGRPGGEIVKAAREADAGLICLTSHGRTGLARLLTGSVAETVLRHAPCPVLVRRNRVLAGPEPSEVSEEYAYPT
jgi:nucleotide-binding universal stress UspA family protein